jgi:hypothetical protein
VPKGDNEPHGGSRDTDARNHNGCFIVSNKLRKYSKHDTEGVRSNPKIKREVQEDEGTLRAEGCHFYLRTVFSLETNQRA